MKQPAFGMVFLLMLLLAAVGGSAEDDASSLQVLHPALRPAVVEAMVRLVQEAGGEPFIIDIEVKGNVDVDVEVPVVVGRNGKKIADAKKK